MQSSFYRKLSSKTKAFVVWVLLLCIPAPGVAQDPAMVDSVLNELFFDEPDLYDLFDGNTKFHFLYIGAALNSGTYYTGREVGTDYANSSGQLYYFISNGLYFGASGAWYSHLDPGFRTAVLSVGYSDSPKWFKYLRYRVSADRFVYLNMGTDFEPSYNSDINAGLSLRYKWIGVRGDYTLLMGKRYDNLASADVFAKIKLWKFRRSDRLQFEPELSWAFGSEPVEYDLNAAMSSDPFYEPNYVLRDDFGLMDVQLSLPLTLGYKNFDFEVAFVRHYPKSLDPSYYYEKSGYWRVSIAYIIPIF